MRSERSELPVGRMTEARQLGLALGALRGSPCRAEVLTVAHEDTTSVPGERCVSKRGAATWAASLFMASLLMASALPPPTHAQETLGHLEGQVLNEQGDPLGEAEVLLEADSPLPSRRLVTSRDGRFRFPSLSVGTYWLTIRRTGYQTLKLGDVVIRLGRTTTLEPVRLPVEALELPEVVVRAARPLLDLTSTTLGGNMPDSLFEWIPAEPDFRSMVSLFPQANASFYLDDDANIAGCSGAATAYFIDGIHVSNPLMGGSSSNIPHRFVREVQVRTAGYQAEYGRSLGGSVNVVTHKGANDFRAQVFGNYAGPRLTSGGALGLAGARMTNLTNHDVGLLVSGPIVRDRLFYSGAYDRMTDDRDVGIPGFGDHEDSRTSHLFAGKLNWQADDRTDFELAVLGDPAKRDFIGPAFDGLPAPNKLASPYPFLGRLESGGVFGSLTGQRVFGPSFVLNGSVSYLSRKDNHLADPDRGLDAPLEVDLETGEWSGGYGIHYINESSRLGLGLRGTALVGPHTLKAGIEYEDNLGDCAWEWNPPNRGFVLRENDTTYTWLYLNARGKTHARIPSMFIQDSWQATQALRLNAGVRWEGLLIVDAGGEIAQKILDQFQPRLGFACAIADRHKLFASYGRFYEQMPMMMINSFYIGRGGQGVILYNHDPIEDPFGGDDRFDPYTQPAAIDGLRGQHFDELAGGFDMQLGPGLRAGVRGTYRELREAIEDAIDPATGEFKLGNPGRGEMTFLPRATHIYKALELSAEWSGPGHAGWLASYVLSRTSGNYAGLYDPNTFNVAPNITSQFDVVESIPNGDGLLPNDRTHVFKLNGTFRAGGGITLGGSLLWASGTPLNELGGTPGGPPYYSFLRQRGSAGRTPNLYDINLRLAYRLPIGHYSTRLLVDWLHIGNPRRAVTVDEVRYAGVDDAGNQVSENPNYLNPTRFQPPTSVRLGMVVDL